MGLEFRVEGSSVYCLGFEVLGLKPGVWIRDKPDKPPEAPKKSLEPGVTSAHGAVSPYPLKPLSHKALRNPPLKSRTQKPPKKKGPNIPTPKALTLRPARC